MGLDRIRHILYFSDANTGGIYFLSLNSTNPSVKKLVGDLNEPRDIALDPKRQLLYFVESSGKIYHVSTADKSNLQKILLISRPSNVRIDTIALSLKGPRPTHKLYWAKLIASKISQTRQKLKRIGCRRM